STDLARVLRLLGFINWKDANHPVRAKIIDWSPERRYSPEDFAHFKAQATEGRRESVKDKDRRYQDLPERIRQAAVLKVRQTCAFMRHCEEDAQSLPYADWFAMVSQLAWFAEVGRKAAHELSEPYDRGSKRYTPEETDKVFDSVLQGAQNGKGPQTCEHIENIVGFPCPHDCPAKSIAMSTPAGLAVHLATAEARNQEHNEAIQQVVQEQSKMEKPRLDDIGNGERFARQHKGKVVWVPEWGWLLWDGKRWRRDAGEVAELAKHTARSIFQEASLERDSEQAKAIAKHAMRTASKNQRDAMVDAAKTEPGILAHVGEFDKDPWLLNCQNGVLDLRDGRLMKHDPALRMTKLANAAYDPEKLCPEWTKFLNTVFEGNQDIIRFVQKATGFSLTGIPPDRVLFMLHGPGGNGKTTLVNTLTNILGDYADDTPPETLAVKRHEQIPNDIAKLHGKRLVTTSELTEGKALNEAIIKKMTGRGRMSARFLHREWFDFTPIHKLWVDTNHKPVIRETSKAIWDRIKLVPFTVTFNEETQDQGLPARLLTESNGILTWMVQGCFLWQQEGLKTPDRVRAATDDYRREMDSIEQFIDDCCVVEATASVKSSTLYEFFRTWASDNGEYTLSGKKFSNRLVEKGFEKKKAKNGVQFCGLGLPVTGVNSGG
ncbi:MAG: phage/plasmid primase, P4 family, partial [Dehalococcoidia bacterium]